MPEDDGARSDADHSGGGPQQEVERTSGGEGDHQKKKRKRKKDKTQREVRSEKVMKRGRKDATSGEGDGEPCMWGPPVLTPDQIGQRVDSVFLTDRDRICMNQVDFTSLLSRAVSNCAETLSVLRYTEKDVCGQWADTLARRNERLSELSEQVNGLKVAKEEAEQNLYDAREELTIEREKLADAERQESELKRKLEELEATKAKEIGDLNATWEKEVGLIKDAWKAEVSTVVGERMNLQKVVDGQKVELETLRAELGQERDGRKTEVKDLNDSLGRLNVKSFNNCLQQVKVVMPDFPVDHLSAGYMVTKDQKRIVKIIKLSDGKMTTEQVFPLPDPQS